MSLLFYVLVAVIFVVSYFLINWLEKKLVNWVINDPEDFSDKNSRLAAVSTLAAVGAISSIVVLVKILVWIF